MKRQFIRTFLVLTAMLLPYAATSAVADDQYGDVVKIPLKDFKFKPPKGVSDPDSVFLFNEDEGKLIYYTNGPAEAKFKLPADGDWDLIITASGDSANNIRPIFLLTIDAPELPKDSAEAIQSNSSIPSAAGQNKGFSKETTLKSDEIRDYRLTVPLKKGEHKLSVAFTNDTYKEGEYDSNFYLHGVKLMPHKADETKK